MTTTLPPARVRRGALLLSGRLHPRDAHPLELAAATRHILTHPNLDADTWRRDRTDVALAELRASLGDWPRAYFGESTLRALVVSARPEECVRCRANMIARVRRLPPPGFDAATNFLLGPGCDRCRRRAQSSSTRPGGASLTSAGQAPLGRPSLARLRAWVDQAVLNDPLLSTAVTKMLGDQPLPGSLGLPPISNDPAHSELR